MKNTKNERLPTRDEANHGWHIDAEASARAEEAPTTLAEGIATLDDTQLEDIRCHHEAEAGNTAAEALLIAVVTEQARRTR